MNRIQIIKKFIVPLAKHPDVPKPKIESYGDVLDIQAKITRGIMKNDKKMICYQLAQCMKFWKNLAKTELPETLIYEALDKLVEPN